MMRDRDKCEFNERRLKQQTEMKQKDEDNTKEEWKLQTHCLHGQSFYFRSVYSQWICWVWHSLWSWLLALWDDNSNHQHTALMYTGDKDEKASDTWKGITKGTNVQRTNTEERTMLRYAWANTYFTRVWKRRIKAFYAVLECMWELYGGFSPLQI